MIGPARRYFQRIVKGSRQEPSADSHVQATPTPPELTAAQANRIRAVLMETYFKGWEAAYLGSQVGQDDMAAHVSGRYRDFSKFVLPWIERAVGLAGKEVVEIGCGTGSSTAGIAPKVASVQAYDIESASIAGAKGRLEALDIQNAEAILVTAESLLGEVRRRSVDGFDVCLLYAVLEHQTLTERLATLGTCWSLLRPGGVLVVNESPNRLLPSDPHTSGIPFFQMLPDELAVLWAKRSLRAAFCERFRDADPTSPHDLLDLARWGRGVSHHEFELALGLNLADVCVGDSYQIEILSMHPLRPEEIWLKRFVEESGLSLPASFTRSFIDVILKKPGGSQAWVPLHAPKSPVVHVNDTELRPDGVLRMSSPSSSIELEIDRQQRHLIIGQIWEPHGGTLLIKDQRGQLVHRGYPRRNGGAPYHYLEVTLPSGVSRLLLGTEAQRLRLGPVLIQYLGLR